MKKVLILKGKLGTNEINLSKNVHLMESVQRGIDVMYDKTTYSPMKNYATYNIDTSTMEFHYRDH